MADANGKLTSQAVSILRNAERHLRKIDPDDRHSLYDFVRATMGKIASVDAFYVGFFGDDMTLVVPHTYDQGEHAAPGVLSYGPNGLSAWLQHHKKTYTYTSDNGRLLSRGHRFGDTTRPSRDAVAVPLIDDTDDVPRVFGLASMQSYSAEVYDASTIQAFEWLCACVVSILRHNHERDRALRGLAGDTPAGIAPTLPELIADLSDKLEVIRVAVVAASEAAAGGEDVHSRLTDLEQQCSRAQHEVFAILTRPSLEVVDLLASLTRREREIANLIADGLTNDEVAQHLTIAAKTVKTHLTSINRKLAVNNRVELVAKLRPFQ